MFFSFRSKLFALSVVLIAAFLLISGLYLQHALSSWTASQIERDLEVRTRLVADATARHFATENTAEFAATLSQSGAGRITLIALDGEVLADTHLSSEELARVENHRHRSEVQAALHGDFGRARRYSTSMDMEMLYGAILSADDGPVVRLAVPLSEVDQVLAHLRLLLIIGGIFGLGVAVFMSSLASSLMSKNLQDLLARSRATPKKQARSLKQITTALEETMATLATERDRFRAVLDGMSEGVLATDHDLRITMSNDAAKGLLKNHRPLENKPLRDLFPEEVIASLLAQAQERGDGVVEFSLPGGAPGAVRHFHARATTRPAAGGVILVVHDVTALRRLETMRRDFVANVSHELRTPVAIIQANAETLLDGALKSPEHARSFTEGIHRNSARLGRLIADLLDISRIEAGQRDFELVPIDLGLAVDRALESARLGGEEHSVVLHLAPELQVQADQGALDQILVNLLDNAFKYGDSEGTVEVRATAQGSRVLVEVCDDGPGIDEAHHDRVFERFYRVDEGRSTQMGGTGLGLSIVKHLVTSMDGEVGYRLRPRGGSIFWFTLPASP